ncbi:helix-turn-helix domain-containing protein [Kineococcus terrestris]|uniref:helix-turn-helix domain-containing protein n=1 Tax=Kineococcus terrestris TaxID=2044856 RepID=UPI0034DAC9C9
MAERAGDSQQEPDDDLEAVLAAVGGRLREVRRRRGRTLREVSAATGISVSTLSRLESGGRRPTLELVLRLARAHDVSVDDLVGAPPTGDPRVNLRPVTRPGWGQTVIPLTRRAGGMQAYKHVLPGRRAGTSEPVPEGKTHEGYEWLYVLDGRLRVVLGEHDVVLGPGEAAEFDCRTPHWFGAADERGVEFLSLFGRQGERAHLRLRPRRAGGGDQAGDGDGRPG